MPAIYRIDHDRRIVFSKGTGVLTDADLKDHQRKLAADPRFEAGFRQLYDLRGVTDVEATSVGVWELAEGNPFGKGSRRAIVADRDVPFGMARMFEMSRGDEGDEVRVFRGMREALAWLGLDEEPDWGTDPDA